MIPRLGTFGALGDFHILAKNHDAFPIIVGAYVIGFHTDERILPHPFNLLSNG
jgi:hypothetical protein